MSTHGYLTTHTRGTNTHGPAHTLCKRHMESPRPADVGRWRKIVELGSGRTGSVALCIEPEKGRDEKTCGEHSHRVFHAVKRVKRQYATSNGALRRVLQEKKALEALRGVGDATSTSVAHSACRAGYVTNQSEVSWRHRRLRLTSEHDILRRSCPRVRVRTGE